MAPDANKTQVKAAVEQLFKVKVAEVRTANLDGKLRRRGRFAGYRSDWKKAYVRLKAGREDARVRGDLSHAGLIDYADEKLQTDNADRGAS